MGFLTPRKCAIWTRGLSWLGCSTNGIRPGVGTAANPAAPVLEVPRLTRNSTPRSAEAGPP